MIPESLRTRLPEAVASNGMISSAHYLASQAGVWMLRRGGNAVDAAVCAAATIAVVEPNLNGVGGDVFAQVWLPAEDAPRGLNASGRSGSLATVDHIRSLGHETMPVRGPLSISVPGAVSGWQELLGKVGTRRLYDILEPAIEYAEYGAPVTRGIASGLAASKDFLGEDPEFRKVFWKDGRLLEEGDVFVNPDLATSLRTLGATDGEAMYRGDIAGRLAQELANAGAPIRREDLAAHHAEWVDPISCEFEGWNVFELPPNSQGIAALEMLNMSEEIPTEQLGHNSAEYVDALCGIISFAIEDRDRYVTDPDFFQAPVEQLASKEYARKRIRAASARPADASDADTIYLCAVDGNGMAVSLIQSQFRGFGSGFMAPGTGIHLNNRGSYFSLATDHVNRLEARKRTMHTLMPGMAGAGNACELVFGTMGGDAQPQIHLQVLLNQRVFGMTVQESIEAPRFVWSPSKGNGKRVALEGRFQPETSSRLRQLGYEVVVLDDWSSQMGHAQAIRIDRAKGLLIGGADPRGDSAALGY